MSLIKNPCCEINIGRHRKQYAVKAIANPCGGVTGKYLTSNPHVSWQKHPPVKGDDINQAYALLQGKYFHTHCRTGQCIFEVVELDC